MKPLKIGFLGALISLAMASMTPPVAHTNRLRTDSLPAGTQIHLEIRLPADATPTHVRYVVPASVSPVTPVPPTPVKPTDPLKVDGFVIGKRGSSQLVVRLFNGKPYLTEVLATGQILVRGQNLLLRDDVESAFKARLSELTGGATAWGGLSQPEGFATPAGYVRRQFADGAIYYEPGVDSPGVASDPDDTKTDDTKSNAVVTPKPNVPDESVIPTPAASSQALRHAVAFSLNSQPNRVNRLQAPSVPAYLDGWAMKQSEIIVSGNGGVQETPDELRKRGHNWFNATWFYGQNSQPWGLPKKDDNLFFEYTGNYWAPYHQDPFRVLVDDLTQIGNACMPRMALWNSVPENGLIDGVPTVKEGHFNIEYTWLLDSEWNKWSADQKNARFFNYAIGRSETLQECFNRGGLPALLDAQHQKWRNIIALSVLYLNANCNGMKAYYGDNTGPAAFHSLANWNRPLSPTQMLTADVNSGMFAEANESANAGRITLSSGQSFDVSGNLNQLMGRRHCYNYEWYVMMKQSDYQAYMSINRDAPADRKNINDWYGRMVPDRNRPYDIAYHALLSKSIAQRKGWSDFKLYWQTETIYESSIYIPDQGYKEEGSWVPWTLNDPSGRPTKIPVHPEVVASLTYLSRMHYDGKFLWGAGCCSRISPETGVGENVHPAVHLTSREAEQAALSELGQYNQTVFTADKRQHLTDVPVLNPKTGQYVTGNPDQLLKANGNPANPVPLVTAVDSPSTGWELYFVYYPHASRDAQTLVRWKSPVDGAELSGMATGWGGQLYARKR